jgi:hypothetical protein
MMTAVCCSFYDGLYRNDDAASVNTCNMYMPQHSKPFFFVRFSRFFFSFFCRTHVDNNQCCNIYVYIPDQRFSFFFYLHGRREKKSRPIRFFFIWLDSLDTRLGRDGNENNTKKSIYIRRVESTSVACC